MNADVCAGLDWASQCTRCASSMPPGGCSSASTVTHDRDGLAELLRRLARYGARVRIAIERPSGLIVDALVEAGYRVFPIHPNTVKASRPRYRSHGAKSDASDAYLLADLLRTDGHRLAPLSPQSDSIRALRALVRARDDSGGLAHGAGQPAAQHARRLLARRGQHLCRHRFAHRSGVPAPLSVAGQGRSADRGPAGALLPSTALQRPAQRFRSCWHACALPHWATPVSSPPHAMGDVVQALVAVLQLCGRHSSTALTRRIERFVASLPDGQIIMSFPRAGRVCAAQILAEMGDVRERFPSDDRLAAEAGVVPLTYESGKTRCVGFRWACNHRLRRAITCLADNSRHANLWARGIYMAARQRGCDHPHAVRILARAWLRVIWRAWFDRKPYDPELHLGALKASKQGG